MVKKFSQGYFEKISVPISLKQDFWSLWKLSAYSGF